MFLGFEYNDETFFGFPTTNLKKKKKKQKQHVCGNLHPTTKQIHFVDISPFFVGFKSPKCFCFGF